MPVAALMVRLAAVPAWMLIGAAILMSPLRVLRVEVPVIVVGLEICKPLTVFMPPDRLILLELRLTVLLTFHGIFEKHNRRVFQGKGTDEVKV